MNHRICVKLCCLLVCLVSPVFAGGLLSGIPLTWSPRTTMGAMGPIDISGPLLKARVRVEAFTDGRQDPALIAENREKKEPRPVTTSGSVASFVTQHVTDALRDAGLTIADGQADFTLSGDIHRFFVTETDTYRGEMSVLFHLRNAAGQEIWSGVVSGAADNFGRSYKAVNYYQTISDMILRTSHDLLANPSLHQALEKG